MGSKKLLSQRRTSPPLYTRACLLVNFPAVHCDHRISSICCHGSNTMSRHKILTRPKSRDFWRRLVNVPLFSPPTSPLVLESTRAHSKAGRTNCRINILQSVGTSSGLRQQRAVRPEILLGVSGTDAFALETCHLAWGTRKLRSWPIVGEARPLSGSHRFSRLCNNIARGRHCKREEPGRSESDLRHSSQYRHLRSLRDLCKNCALFSISGSP